MLSSRDQATIVEEMTSWMAKELRERGLDSDKIVVRGHYSAESGLVVLIIQDRLRRRRGLARTYARATVSVDPTLRAEQARNALDYVMRMVKADAPELLMPDAFMSMDPIPAEVIQPPTEKDWDEARRIVERMTARRDQRPSKRRGDDAGTPDRTTGSS